MARIRTIKPEFWSDEKIGPLAPIHRLVFLGLVSQADDGGRLVDSVRLIDGLLFSMTADSCAQSLETLADLGLIERGTTASGQRVVQIVGWSKHQKVDKPSSRGVLPPIQAPNGKRRSSRASAIPAPSHPPESLAEVSREPRDTLAGSSRYEVDLGAVDLGPSTLDHGPRTEEVDLRAGSGAGSEDPDPDGPSVGRSDSPNGSTPHGDDPPPTDPLVGFGEIAGKLASLRHGGGYHASAEFVLDGFLYAPGYESPTVGEDAVRGLSLAERERLVLSALADYRTTGHEFKPRLFAGFVERLRGEPKANGASGDRGIVKLHQPAEPAPDEPPPDPEARAAGLALVAAAVGAVKSEPMPDVEIRDPHRVAARETSRERQKRMLSERRNGDAG